MDIGQAHVAAAVAERQALIIQTKHVQDRGVQVVHRDRVFNGVHSELVCRAVNRASFDASSGQPYTEA